MEDVTLREKHLKAMTEVELAAAIAVYEAIICALEEGELRVVNFVTKVKTT